VQRVIVVGAGVIGLSCAVRLAEAGFDAHVLARDLPLETTSAVAGGLWLPYLAQPAELVDRWGATTLTELTKLAEDEGSGVRLTTGTLLHAAAVPPRPTWASAGEPALQQVHDPRPGYRSGWRLTVPLVDTTRYLPWLARRLADAGGTVTRMPLGALPQRGVVVNATGVSARAIAGDATVRPVRGQVVVLENPGLTEWWCDEDEADGPLYALPRGDHVVVGGTADDGNWDTTPDPSVAERILQRATAVDPRLRGAVVRAHRVGLRPARPRVRLETVVEPEVGRAVVHCYGHGGAGVTLSWGCADDVLAEVSALV
jgi:D-amino-acid oxidase